MRLVGVFFAVTSFTALTSLAAAGCSAGAEPSTGESETRSERAATSASSPSGAPAEASGQPTSSGSRRGQPTVMVLQTSAGAPETDPERPPPHPWTGGSDGPRPATPSPGAADDPESTNGQPSGHPSGESSP